MSAWAPEDVVPGPDEASGTTLKAAGRSDPSLRQMPAMIRRHVAGMGRFACEVAYGAAGDVTDVPIVFSSRYGEVSRSVDLLSALAEGAELSPTTFGLSVHNANLGLLAMARHDSANGIAIAAGDESAEFGILEACGLLADGAERVLLIVADHPLPSMFAAFEDVRATPFAWALLLTPASTAAFSLEWTASPGVPAVTNKPAGAMTVLRFLQTEAKELVRRTATREWRWRRDA